MRKAYLVFCLFVVVLAACGGGGAAETPLTLDQQMTNYEASLRAEADWLWSNMNYATTHARPETSQCAARDFKHKPVELDDTTRQTDLTAGSLVDNLNYVAELIGQARDQWKLFCDNQINSATASAFLESRLRPAYETLNTITTMLEQRITPSPVAQ